MSQEAQSGYIELKWERVEVSGRSNLFFFVVEEFQDCILDAFVAESSLSRISLDGGQK